MAKVYPYEAVVYVWRNRKKWGFIPTTRVGHAAVKVRGATDDDFACISWWPGEESKSGSNPLVRAAGQASERHRIDRVGEISDKTQKKLQRLNYVPKADDKVKKYEVFDPDSMEFISIYGKRPDYRQTINGLECPGRMFGLATERMQEWWEGWNPTGRYRMLSKTENCAGVAIQGLVEGGAEAFVPAPKFKWYAEPNSVEQYAMRLYQAIGLLNQDANAMAFAAGYGPMDDLPPQTYRPGGGLWSVDEWLNVSTERGVTGGRHALLRKVDENLERYHESIRKSGLSRTLVPLARMMRALADFHKLDANRLRGPALALVLQIRRIFRDAGTAVWQAEP